MPRISKKSEIISFIVENVENQLCELSDDETIDAIVEEAVEDVLLVSECRRGIEEVVQRSHVWRNDVLTEMDDGRFKQMLRLNRQQFSQLVTLLSNDQDFQKAHSTKQFPLELQLAIVLYRLGAYGENAAIRKIATIFGVGDGGTIDKITHRVFKAILRLQSQFIFWPDKEERERIVAETFHELPFCIGYVDGTEIKLAEAPVREHVPFFFSKSRCYCLKAQVVCDHNLKIRHFAIGHVESSHDAKIFKSSALFKREKEFFSGFQWVAGDSAYPLTETDITPYRINSQQLDAEKRKTFNLRHRKFRVRIEHGFGILKEKFGSLKELRMRMHNDASWKFCCDWFRVCCVLHNILITKEDAEACTTNFDVSQSNEVLDSNLASELGRNRFEIKRQALYHMIFD